ncbi:MAG: glycosyltransferase family 39 protein [Chloroflexi bacterium]|nr:glycosyltransferase family 39 protein [Chloroflexota bacterium]
MNRTRRVETVALLSLVLVAAALRSYRLNAQDIWGDEAFSIYLSQQPLSTVVAGAADTHPPFYPVLLFLWLRLAGDSAYATRALSALIGVLIVPLIFVLAERLTPLRPRVKWFASIMAAISPLLVYYSQETRMYELATVLALASCYFGLRVIDCVEIASVEPRRTTDTRFAVAGFLGSTALAMYTHYSAFFVWCALNLYAALRLYRNRAALVRWAILQAVLIAAYVPWIVVQASFLTSKASTRFDEWGPAGVEMIFGRTFLSFSAGLTVDFPIVQIAAAVFLSAGLLGIFGLVRRRSAGSSGADSALATTALGAARFDPGWFAPIYFLAPVAVAYVVNPVMPFFFERYVLVALPGFALTVALGLDSVARSRAPAAVILTVVLIGFSALSLRNYYFDDAYAKGKYGQMMAYVSSHAQPGDALILNNPLQKPLYLYYAPRGVPAYYFPDNAPLEDPGTRQRLADVAHNHKRLWLVMFGNPAEYDPTGYLARWLGTNAFKSYFGGYVDASLTLYEMPDANAKVQRFVDARLGQSIRLLGYDLDRSEVAPGESLELTLHWQADAPVPKAYKVFTHLIGALNPASQSTVWAQMDGEPVGGTRPTNSWGPGDSIQDRFGLMVPANAPPGEYEIEVGMYDPATLARLPVYDASGHRLADDRVLLTGVSVSAK